MPVLTMEGDEKIDIGKEFETALMHVLCRDTDNKSGWENPTIGRWAAYPILPGSWGGMKISLHGTQSPSQLSIPNGGVAHLNRTSEGYQIWQVTPCREQWVGVRRGWQLIGVHVCDDTSSICAGVRIGWGPKSGWVEWDEVFDRWLHKGTTKKAIYMVRASHSMNATFGPLWKAKFSLAGVQDTTIDLPLQDIAAARDLLNLRDVIPGQRKKALMHWVREHYRTTPTGKLVKIGEHLRGAGENIKIDDFVVDLTPSSIAESAFHKWRDGRQRRAKSKRAKSKR